MHLAQQTVLVVMMVVFSSTLIMAAGLVLMLLMAGLSDGRLLVHGLAYGMLAMLSFSTIITMLRSVRGRTSIGAPLVLASHLVLLGSQVSALSYGAAFKGTAVTPFFLQTTASVWPLAPLVAVLLGLFGFSLMAMEQIIARNESGARLDALTGLLNRGALDMTAIGMVARWQRDGDPLSCLVIDVDHFKFVNDRHGHHAGDNVLREIAAALDNSRRASDIAARYGGEEFCILCPHTDEHQATALANRILRKVRAVELPAGEGPGSGHASVSIGIAQLHVGPPNREALWRNLFAEADRALYLAKQRGRDQYVLGSSMQVTGEGAGLQTEVDCVTTA